jgi:hypothetical protein
MTVILRIVRGTAAAVVATAAMAAVMSGALASRAAAQTVPIPMLTPAKAAANKAAAASNAQTAAMQAVGDASPANAAGSTTTTTSVTHVRTTTVTPISASASQPPQQKQPVKSTASTTPSASPIKPVLSVGSTPARTAVSVTSATVPVNKNMPAAKGAAVAGNAAVAGPPSDSGAQSISVTQRGTKGEVSLNREVFSYDPGARRDPFVSLMRSGELRPMLSDLRLVTVLYDPTGRNSIAVMHDLSTKDQYRVRVGQTLGRMRVAQIQPKQVVFTVEEVGFSRQEALALGDTTKARMQ